MNMVCKWFCLVVVELTQNEVNIEHFWGVTIYEVFRTAVQQMNISKMKWNDKHPCKMDFAIVCIQTYRKCVEMVRMLVLMNLT